LTELSIFYSLASTIFSVLPLECAYIPVFIEFAVFYLSLRTQCGNPTLPCLDCFALLAMTSYLQF